jgi:hypothetical protein
MGSFVQAQKLFFSWILPVMLIGIGASWLSFGAFHLMRANASLTWPQAEGAILSSQAKRENPDNKLYTPRIQYSYSVGAKSYTGSRLRYGVALALPLPESQEIVRAYPPRAAARVHYKPDDPAESVLEPGLNPQVWEWLYGGALFLGGGLFMVVFLRRWIDKIDPNPVRDGSPSPGRP